MDNPVPASAVTLDYLICYLFIYIYLSNIVVYKYIVYTYSIYLVYTGIRYPSTNLIIDTNRY